MALSGMCSQVLPTGLKSSLSKALLAVCLEQLGCKQAVAVEALIGITIDKDKIILVNISDSITTEKADHVVQTDGKPNSGIMSASDGQSQTSYPAEMKVETSRKRRSSSGERQCHFSTLNGADLESLKSLPPEYLQTPPQNMLWGVKIFKEFLVNEGHNSLFEYLPAKQINTHLMAFYASVRRPGGMLYSKTAMIDLRQALNRHLQGAPYMRKVDIIKDKQFREANQVYVGIMQNMKGCWKSVVHQGTLTEDEWQMMYRTALGVADPVSLQRKVFVEIGVHLKVVVKEMLRELNRNSFKFEKDENGAEYVICESNSKDERRNLRMRSEPGNPNCPVKSLRFYLKKLNPNQNAFFQYPLRGVSQDGVWYEERALGKTALSKVMPEISRIAGLRKEYHNGVLKVTQVRATPWPEVHRLADQSLVFHRQPFKQEHSSHGTVLKNLRPYLQTQRSVPVRHVVPGTVSSADYQVASSHQRQSAIPVLIQPLPADTNLAAMYGHLPICSKRPLSMNNLREEQKRGEVAGCQIHSRAPDATPEKKTPDVEAWSSFPTPESANLNSKKDSKPIREQRPKLSLEIKKPRVIQPKQIMDKHVGAVYVVNSGKALGNNSLVPTASSVCGERPIKRLRLSGTKINELASQLAERATAPEVDSKSVKRDREVRVIRVDHFNQNKDASDKPDDRSTKIEDQVQTTERTSGANDNSEVTAEKVDEPSTLCGQSGVRRSVTPVQMMIKDMATGAFKLQPGLIEKKCNTEQLTHNKDCNTVLRIVENKETGEYYVKSNATQMKREIKD